ncbi:MAG: hypothetical protein U9N49_07180, partial [Campylobacterota bacterium]|nr:hypothetical protein [Campylobacterota bacterium]
SPLYPLKNKSSMFTNLLESEFNFKYLKDNFKFMAQLFANYQDVDGLTSDSYSVNQLFLEYKFSDNHLLSVGKKAPKWGKGYFANPVAFIDRKKDPHYPEHAKEGYSFLSYSYNKSYSGELKNFAFDLVYMPTTKDINSDFYNNKSHNVIFKSYFLYKDIDIDLIYLYSNKQNDKIGVDFSTNLQTNFEIHAEIAKEMNSGYSYLLGLKYLTQNELTIIIEYLYQSERLDRSEPFFDKQYLFTKLTQKEPFDILYSTIYYKNSLNLEDRSHLNGIGFTYSFKNNFEIDISYNQNFGEDSSEFGSKLTNKFFWTQLNWYF